MNIVVFRLGHRPFRDKRITTHVFLAARAFGASGGLYSGDKDFELEERIGKVADNFGGSFSLSYEKGWKGVVEKWKKTGRVVHLTMYGVPFEDVMSEITTDNLLIVVGGEKVPSELYKDADYNVSVTNQPHSEVSALGVFLHSLVRGGKVKPNFQNSKFKIIPNPSGKSMKEMNI
ncbi:tRNA (cytidine(56)-2'-O)-methyltransferase [Candidatus Micrarchaeota archaeon]|nr:tRNA (cytidine(56)-2'-O)-methyltransferase [Candidatus Micrarchaeota archaeon]